MADATKRIANYTDGINPDRIKDKILALKPEMSQSQAEQQTALAQIYARVQAVLASEGAVTTMQVKYYFAYAMAVYALTRKHYGAQLNGQVALKLAEVKAHGGNEAVLIRIRNEVFGIPSPAAPKGYLQLETEPVGAIGAKIYINLVDSTKVTPQVAMEFDPGDYTIKLTHVGYVDDIFTITVTDGHTLAIVRTMTPMP